MAPNSELPIALNSGMALKSYGCFAKLGLLLVGVLIISTLLFGISVLGPLIFGNSDIGNLIMVYSFSFRSWKPWEDLPRRGAISPWA